MSVLGFVFVPIISVSKFRRSEEESVVPLVAADVHGCFFYRCFKVVVRQVFLRVKFRKGEGRQAGVCIFAAELLPGGSEPGTNVETDK